MYCNYLSLSRPSVSVYVHIILLDHDGEVWPEVLEYSTARIPYWGSYKWATGVRDGAQAFVR